MEKDATRRLALIEPYLGCLSLSNWSSYVCLTNWILRFPQILHEYSVKFLEQPKEEKITRERRSIDLFLIIGVITMLAMVLLTLIYFLVAIPSRLFPTEQILDDLANAFFWGVMVLIVPLLVSLYRRVPAQFALFGPLLGVISLSAYTAFYFQIRMESLSLAWLLFFPYLFMGIGLGLLRSVLAAYYSDAVPNQLRFISYGLFCCLLPLFILYAAHYPAAWSLNEIGSAAVYILTSLVAYYVSALRLDDWLWPFESQWDNSQNTGKLGPPLPRVTPQQRRDVGAMVEAWLDNDWQTALANILDIWRYTLQRQYVVEALLRYWGDLTSADREEQIRYWVVHDNIGATRTMYELEQLSYLDQISHALSLRSVRSHGNALSLDMLRQEKNEIDGRTRARRLLALLHDQKYHFEVIYGNLPRLYDTMKEDFPNDLVEILNVQKTLQGLADINNILSIDQHNIPDVVNLPRKRLSLSSKAIADIAYLMRYAVIYRHCDKEQTTSRTQIRELLLAELPEIQDDLQCNSVNVNGEDVNTGAPATIELTDAMVAKQLCQIIDNWRSKIQSETPDTIPYVPAPVFNNPFGYAEPLYDSPTFVGRESLIQSMQRAWNSNHFLPLEIVGPVLMGKSSLVCTIERRLAHIHFVRVSLQHLNSSVAPATRIHYAIYDRMRERFQIDSSVEEQLLTEPYRTIEEMIRQTTQFLDSPNEGLVLVLDDFDHIDRIVGSPEFRRLLSFLYYLSESISNFGLIILRNVGDNGYFASHKASASRTTSPIVVPPIDNGTYKAGETAQLLNGPHCIGYYMFHRTAIEEITRQANGNAYLLQAIAWNIVEYYERALRNGFRNEERKRSKDPLFTLQDVNTVLLDPVLNDAFLHYVERLIDCFDEHAEIARFILHHFATADESVSSLSFRSICQLVKEQNITATKTDIRVVLDALCAHYVLRQENQDGNEDKNMDNSENGRYSRNFEMLRLFSSPESK